jgi:hypothetical protein
MNNIATQYNISLLPYFLLFSFYVRISFFILHNYLNIFNKKYITYPTHRKQYITKNIVKSVNLGALTLFSMPCIIYPAYFYNSWNNDIMKLCGLFYSSNDFIALVCVKKLSPTTKNHHRVTVFLSLVSLGIDFTTSTLGRMLFVYTLASSSAFIVNYYLGMRFLEDKEKTKDLKKMARNIYGVSLLSNWGWHLYWSTNYYYLLGPEHFIYFFMLFWIVKDDIILFKWLCN